MIKQELLQLVEKVHNLKKDEGNSLPDNSYFLDDNSILCYQRTYGKSSYPYQVDSMRMFAHTNGYIDCVDGLFNIFKPVFYNEDTNIAFFAGEEYEDGFFPISITGATRQLFEKGIERYTVFTPVCTYYISETEKAIFAAQAYITDKKHLKFSLAAINKGEQRNIYLCSYFEPTIRYVEHEDFYHKMMKFGERFPNGNYIVKYRSGNNYDYLSAKVAVTGDIAKRSFTTAKRTVLRGGANLTNALALKNGCFSADISKTNTSDFPVISDMIHFSLEENGFAEISYEMTVTKNYDEAHNFIENQIDPQADYEYLCNQLAADEKIFKNAEIKFNDWHNENLHGNVINRFLKCVQHQISLCALGDRYVGQHLGVRDVFQQLETSLIWQPKESRKQILRVLDCILEDGRPPRQVSFPTEDNTMPVFDMMPYIDQGMWILSTIHTYLSYTGDFSILDEVCGYYMPVSNWGMARVPRSEIKDTVLDHIIKITNYLISNIDEETNCIHILRGDWNDAINAVGQSSDPEKKFGNGVSIMATLQLYLGLGFVCEILEKLGKYPETVKKYNMTKYIIKQGIEANAIDFNEENGARIIHGWGENKSFLLGSYNDVDGNSRLSLTSNSFFAISGLIKEFPQLKDDIAENILALDSVYGLKTFNLPFTSHDDKLGSIGRITAGTLENGSVYVHASTFGIMALFLLGYSKEAWEQMEKSMVISHENVSRSTFVMPNSYFSTEEFGDAGFSMGDWYTGSGTVLIKNMIKCGFGIEPTLSTLKLIPPAYFPSKTAELNIKIKGENVTVKYENRGEGMRSIYMNGEKLPLLFDDIRGTYYAEIPDSKLNGNIQFLITD